MLRKIIKIDEALCNGCGLCAAACHEGAIDIIDGKAKLAREDYCDGLGDCLPNCPTGAITFEVREAPAYNETAVKEAQLKKLLGGETSGSGSAAQPAFGGCPGSRAMTIQRSQQQAQPGGCPGSAAHLTNHAAHGAFGGGSGMEQPVMQSQLAQWPVQIKLVPVNAPYFQQANLLIAADCTAYAYGNFHNRFIRNHITVIGCPKLDEGDYTEKLTEILRNNDIKSLTIVRMEVPCCGGIERAAKTALQESGKFIPWQVYTISTDGEIIE